jgi:hypothetical protein
LLIVVAIASAASSVGLDLADMDCSTIWNGKPRLVYLTIL